MLIYIIGIYIINRMNIQESIIRILKEETSLQLRLRDVIRTHGLKKAIKSVGGTNNFKKNI